MQDKNIKPQPKLSNKSTAFLEMLTNRGLVDDKLIKDDKIRKAEKDKKRKMFHNTSLMLQHYRNIAWMLECFPENIAEELDAPMKNLDALISAQAINVLSLRLWAAPDGELDSWIDILTILENI